MPRSVRCSVFLLLLLFFGVPGRAAAQHDSDAVVSPTDVPAPAPQTVITGIVQDSLSERPLRVAVVRIVETGVSTLTDDGGRYRLTAPTGPVTIEVRRIGYEPLTLPITLRGRFMMLDIALRPVAIGLEAVTVTDVDEFARRLMQRVIARKHEVFHDAHDFKYETYVKFVIRDLDQHPDSAQSVLLITETRTTAYWEEPNHFQERIIARRQTSNLSAFNNLIGGGELANFSRDRIEIPKYSIVSPIADDAFDYYDYHLLDTLEVDGHRVYRVGIEPRTQVTPLFVGMIDIADSTYDILQMDVRGNDVVRVNGTKNLRYRQRFRDVGGGRWMPYDISFTGEVLILPLPGVPTHMAFEHHALLDGFEFDLRSRPAGLKEFRLVVDDAADHPDSSRWTGPGAIPLTHAEQAAWQRIDSIANLPPDLSYRVLRGMGTAYRLSKDPEFFHFNRVDGTYLGAGGIWDKRPELRIDGKLGYATGSDIWQYRVGGGFRISESQRTWLEAHYYDETLNRPTFISRDYNPTYRALFFRLDPLDYYRENGVVVALNTKLFDFTDFTLRYRDARQSNLSVITDYSLFSVERPQRPNPAIFEGRMRALSASFAYDSRPLLRSKGQDFYLEQYARNRTRIALQVEVSDPAIIPSDFDYQRYAIQIERRQRTFNLGVTTIVAAAGLATGDVPPQRYFVVDYGMKALTFQGNGFNTLSETNYMGTRGAMITVRHNFDRLLFAKSRIPVIRDLPFTLSIHGGAFWTSFASADNPPPLANLPSISAQHPYTEVGFGLGNLTPFLAPLNFAAHFTWQLSSYPTNRFTFGFGLTPP
ncbi:MAG TPA: DUF5686 family protein [Gemmatimonadales bacterium]|nr:DUF5686 family protein [Gemmatimonadales bacterium]